jgi:hypothetical protein
MINEPWKKKPYYPIINSIIFVENEKIIIILFKTTMFCVCVHDETMIFFFLIRFFY